MYQKRIVHLSLQATDPAFLTKVLFAIDSALQIHWQSCCQASDQSLVNDKVLLMPRPNPLPQFHPTTSKDFSRQN
jgi:hypothetical protein